MFALVDHTSTLSAQQPQPLRRQERRSHSGLRVGRGCVHALLCNDASRDFVVAALYPLTEKHIGETVMNPKPSERIRLCVPASGDHVAAIGTNGKLLVFL